jgi:hypothetical protein
MSEPLIGRPFATKVFPLLRGDADVWISQRRRKSPVSFAAAPFGQGGFTKKSLTPRNAE